MSPPLDPEISTTPPAPVPVPRAPPDPAAENPFDHIGAGPSSQNPFDAIGPNVAAPTSTTGAFARGAVRGAVPAFGSLPAIGAGAEAGAVFGPWGALAGGLAGGLGGGYALSKAQDYLLSKAPDSWKEAIGLDDRQEKLDQARHPYASFLGGLAPYAVTMRPGAASRAALPENATALQTIMAHPATARVFGGAVMGGIELGQEAASGETPDWAKVGISTGFGVVFNKPTRIGESLTELGARPARRVLGRPEPSNVIPFPAPEATAEAASVAPEATPTTVTEPPPGVTAREWNETILGQKPPITVADAADLGVMGPGHTEDTFQGSREPDPTAVANAREAKQTERSIIDPPGPPDVHAVAERMAPETLGRYRDLTMREAELRLWVAEDPQSEQAKAHLAAAQEEMDRLYPDVQAAYRRAAERTGTPIVEAEAPTLPATEGAPAAGEGRPIAEQRQFIRNDVARQLIRAGRPAEEAEAAGALIAARYEARAARLGGKAGAAEDLYRNEAPEILGPGMRSTQAPGIPQPRGPRKVEEEKLSLLQFLAHKGGLQRTADLESILDKNPFVPGFGRLFRQNGMTADRAREAASEAGYLENNVATTGEQATIRELLAAIHEEAHGRRRYRHGQEPEGAPVEGPEPPEDWTPGEVAPSPASPYMTEEDSKALADTFFQRKRDLIAEREAQGQMGLPGTERISDAERAQRLADAKLRPTVIQKPMDEGLFGDADKQRELFQRDQAPPFYSAVERAITSAKQDKASPEQWLGMLKNMPGVKPEELEWLGLHEWLRDQKGPVTKAQVADYVRANQIEVKEVEKGGNPEAIARARQDVEAAGQNWDDLSPRERLDHINDARRVGGTKFASYTLPGGENYRELLLTLPVDMSKAFGLPMDAIAKRLGYGGWSSNLPEAQRAHIEQVFEAQKMGPVEFNEHIRDLEDKKHLLAADRDPVTNRMRDERQWHDISREIETLNAQREAAAQAGFKSSHWDEPNVLAHIRFNDRVIDGKKTLLVEEVQSDFGQTFRREQQKIADAVDRDFDTIADKMVKAGIITKVCD